MENLYCLLTSNIAEWEVFDHVKHGVNYFSL